MSEQLAQGTVTEENRRQSSAVYACLYWRRLVNYMGRGRPKYWEKRVVITNEGIGVFQLLGARVRAAPKSTCMLMRVCV